MNIRTLKRKQTQSQQDSSPNLKSSYARAAAASNRAHPILHLQRTMGNQAVLWLLQTQQDGLAVGSAHAPITTQPRLAVNTPGDSCEQEADRVSEQVMRMPEPQLLPACSCGGGCPRCQVKPSKGGAMYGSEQTAPPPLVHEVLASSGHPLDASARAFFEPRFGHDFSNVRVHVDSVAEQSTHGLHAKAYTTGHNIVFGAGQFAPETQEGRRLIAHELTHVVQQSRLHNSAQGIQRWPWPIGGGGEKENDCSGYEKDPESLSVETAKHFLDEVEPGGSRLVQTTDCKANVYNPDRIECEVTFEGGQVIQVSIESKLHNVEGQRPTANGRQWCVYHFTCDSNGVLQWHKLGCSGEARPNPSPPSGPDLVG
jgi:hypothetical protein